MKRFGFNELLMIWLPFAVLFGLLTSGALGNWNVTFERTFEQDYDTCQDELKKVNGVLTQLKQEREVYCKCPQTTLSLFGMLWAFFVGAISVGFFILVGYPWIQDKLEEKKEPKVKR